MSWNAKMSIAWKTSIQHFFLLKTSPEVWHTYVEHNTPARPHAPTAVALLDCFSECSSEVRACALRASGVYIFSMGFICYVFMRVNLEYMTKWIGGQTSDLEVMVDSKRHAVKNRPCREQHFISQKTCRMIQNLSPTYKGMRMLEELYEGLFRFHPRN